MTVERCVYRRRQDVPLTVVLLDRKQGFNRNLTVSEIIGQLWQGQPCPRADPKGERVISNVVLMGMGEPLAQFREYRNGPALDARRQCLWSVASPGYRVHVRVVPVMDRLGDECPVALAVSLHAPNDKFA